MLSEKLWSWYKLQYATGEGFLKAVLGKIAYGHVFLQLPENLDYKITFNEELKKMTLNCTHPLVSVGSSLL